MQTKPPCLQQTQLPDFQAGSLAPERTGGSGMFPMPCFSCHLHPVLKATSLLPYPAVATYWSWGPGPYAQDAGVLGESVCGRMTRRPRKSNTWGCTRARYSSEVAGWSSLYLPFLLYMMEKQACKLKKKSNNRKIFSLHESREWFLANAHVEKQGWFMPWGVFSRRGQHCCAAQERSGTSCHPSAQERGIIRLWLQYRARLVLLIHQ